jgi:hypothetical protein
VHRVVAAQTEDLVGGRAAVEDVVEDVAAKNDGQDETPLRDRD